MIRLEALGELKKIRNIYSGKFASNPDRTFLSLRKKASRWPEALLSPTPKTSQPFSTCKMLFNHAVNLLFLLGVGVQCLPLKAVVNGKIHDPLA